MDPAFPELDDRVDHLLFLGLEDALLAAPLDEQLELLGADLGIAAHVAAERPGDCAGQRREQGHDRSQHPAEDVDEATEAQCVRLRVGQRERLRDELPEHDREQRSGES